MGSPGEPIFASSYNGELWPAVAEKAYAKAHKGYIMISSGTTGCTIRDFCGAPFRTYRLEINQDPNYEIWEAIKEGE